MWTACARPYDIYESEYKRALDAGLVIPAYDYVLKCSHLFNVLDARGAIGVTERASYFRRMRDMTRKIARAYADQRQEMEYPLDKLDGAVGRNGEPRCSGARHGTHLPDQPADFLFEIGVEELPADDVDAALDQLSVIAPKLFDDLRLAHGDINVYATPRRLVIHAQRPRAAPERSGAGGQGSVGGSRLRRRRQADQSRRRLRARQGRQRGRFARRGRLCRGDGARSGSPGGRGAGGSAAGRGRGAQVRQVDALERQQRRLLAPDPLVRRAARRGGDPASATRT